MRRLLIVLVLLVGAPQWSSAEDERQVNNHRNDIKRLSQLIAGKDFTPLTVEAEGKDFGEALARAATAVRDHLGLRSLAPEMCGCLRQANIIPSEQRALLKTWDFTVTETTSSGDRSVKLVVRLDSGQLKQLALFEMWPLFSKKFISRVST